MGNERLCEMIGGLCEAMGNDRRAAYVKELLTRSESSWL